MDSRLPVSDIDEVLDVDAIDVLQTSSLASEAWPEDVALKASGLFLSHVLENHRLNSLLWNEEDKARRSNVPDSDIAANKRAIDGYNQRRNDAIEAIDDVILNVMAMEAAPPTDEAWVNSETAGSIIDRLSIGSLKIHHMGLQCQRRDVSDAHREQCLEKLKNLQAQRAHLSSCLRSLLSGMLLGRCTYRVYRQFKMYNDPKLNPYLYGATSAPIKEA